MEEIPPEIPAEVLGDLTEAHLGVSPSISIGIPKNIDCFKITFKNLPRVYEKISLGILKSPQ